MVMPIKEEWGMGRSILVVDDHMSFCRHIQAILSGNGYEVDICGSPLEALEMLRSRPYDILLTDMRLPHMDGIKLFEEAKKIDQTILGIIMTAYGTIPSAVEAIKRGVSDYIQKPFDPEALIFIVQKVSKEKDVLEELNHLRDEIDQKYSFESIIGKNYKMIQIFDLIKKIAPTDARVLIMGETGTGKELIAKAIHYNSLRKSKPFVGINCCALPETLLESELFGYEKGAFTGAFRTKKGKFEYAKGGTVFLDEIGDLSQGMQVKLLRVLQEKRFERLGGNKPIEMDVRIIAATNQDLRKKIENSEFRLDLFYRLSVVHIYLPPLRDRKEDIPLLVEHFLKRISKSLGRDIKGVTREAMAQLMNYDWPGNVRELENVLERSCLVAEKETLDRVIFFDEVSQFGTPTFHETSLPFRVARQEYLARFEKDYILHAIKRCQGSVAEASKYSKIPLRTMWRKLQKYGIDPKGFKRKTS